MTAAIITGITGFRRPPAIRKMWKYVKRIFLLGYPSILMQALYTVYIVALNFILVGFSDAAVIVLGLYYKMQSFFLYPAFRTADVYRACTQLQLHARKLYTCKCNHA